MNLNFVTGCTLYDATKHTIKKIDCKNLEQKNLVVVPDSFSMQAESLIFDILKVKSTFNISVVGISRLAGKILREHDIPFERVSGLVEILLTYKAIKLNEDKFQYFKNYGIDFCVKVLQILKQFSNCFIKAEDIVPCDDIVLSYKMHDLRLIYETYLKLLEDKLDLSKLLSFFLEKSEFLDLKNYNLYFVNFDSFSTEIFDFICNLAEKVNSVYIAISKSLGYGNSYIYEDDTTKKMFNFASMKGIGISVEEKKENLPKGQEAIIKNAFSVKPEQVDLDFFTNVEVEDRNEEINFVAKYIRYQIYQGERFKNFSIAVPSEEYFKDIENVFAKYDIPIYMDYTLNLKDVALTNVFTKIFNIALGGFSRGDIEYLLSCPLFAVENRDEKLKYIDFYDVENIDDYKKFDNSLNDLIEIIEDISNCKTIGECCEFGQKFLDYIKPNLDVYLSLIENLQKRSENEQAFSMISKILSQIAEFDIEENISLKDFIFLLGTVFQSVKVETVPSYIDAVYVGDATKSYFEDTAYLFVLGALAGVLPKTEKDCGLITDEDLSKLNYTKQIEPEIRVINRRNRLKLFEVLQHATKRLFALTPLSQDDKKANFVEDLIKTFGKKSVVKASSFKRFDRADLSEEDVLKLVCFNLGGKEVAEKNFKKIENNLSEDISGSINLCVGHDIFNFGYENLKNKVLLNKISASSLENYFSCPFKFFVSYLLNVKQKECAKEDKRKIGIFKHDLARQFVEKYLNLKVVNEEDVDRFLNENFEKSAKKVLENVTLENKIFMHILKNECAVMLGNIAYEQKQSDFKPMFLEKFVSGTLGGLKFVGVIDRVDFYKNYFRIIDYKTGQTGSILKDLYYGKKLQLFLYASCIARQENKECAGVYYFDCKNKFKKKNVSTKLLDGLSLKDNDVVYATDFRLQDEGVKSDLIGATRKKKAGDDGFLFKYGNFTDDFKKYFDYAVNVSEKAIKEIESGYIEPKPLGNECDFCEFNAICKNRAMSKRKQTSEEF